MSRISFLVLVMALAVPCPETSAQNSDPLSAIRSAIAAGERGKARAALDSLSASAGLLSEGEIAELRYLQSQVEEDGTESEALLLTALAGETSPSRRGSLYLTLGRLAFARGDLEEALLSFREARAQGRHEEGSLWEGLTAFFLGDGAAARDALSAAAASGNRAIRQRALLALGDTYRVGGDCEEALKRYQEIREEQGRGPGWWAAATLRAAECEQELENPDRARELLVELGTEASDSYEAPPARALLAALGGEPSAPEVTPEPSRQPPEEGDRFALQVGAFRLPANADALAGQVAGAGFGPVRKEKGEDGLFRVFVGSFENRNQAESLGDSLGSQLGLSYSVVWGLTD